MVPDPKATLADAGALYAQARFEAAAAAFAGAARTMNAPAERLQAMAGWERALKAMACEPQAIAVQHERLSLADSIGDAPARRLSLARLARLTLPTDSVEADRLARLALEGIDADAADDSASDAHTTLAILAIARGEFDAADVELSLALGAATSALRRSEAWRTLGSLREADGHYGAPREAYDRSLQAALDAGDAEARALAAIYLSGVLAQAEPTRAAALLEQARLQARQSAMRRVEALADKQEGLPLRLSARYVDRVRANELLTRAQERYREIGDAAQERAVLLALAVCRHTLGDEAGAFAAAQRSGELSRRLGYVVEAAKAEHLLALLSLERDPPDFGDAEQRLQGVLDDLRPFAGRTQRGRVLHDLAVVELSKGDSAAALASLVQAQQLVAGSQEDDAPALRELLWLTTGWTLLEAGQADNAAVMLRTAASAASGEVRGRAWWGLAQLSEPTAPDAALVYYQRALRDIDPLRPRGLDLPATARPAFERRYSSLYRDLAALLLRLRQPAAAHYVATLMQRMELLEAHWEPQRGEVDSQASLAFGIVAAPAACEGTLAEREGTYARLWLRREAIATPALRGCCADAGNCAEPADRTQQFCGQDREVETVRKALARDEADCVASLQTASSETLFAVAPEFGARWRKAVGAGVTLVVTLLGKEQLHVLVRSSATANYVVRTRSVGRQQVQDLMTRWRIAREEAAAQRLTLRGDALRADQVQRVAALRLGLLREMYDLLFGDMPGKLLTPQTDARRSFIAVALDGPLRELPMAALFDGERYLGERAAIALLTPSTLDARETRAAAPARALVLGVASLASPPLPHVEAEVKQIAQLLGTPVYLDQAASKARLMGWLRSLDGPALALHVAAHGEIGETPASTAIHLWGDDLTGLQIADVSEQLAQVRLVVLSSCESAGHGSGNMALGLAGLVERGTRSVVGSLWKVDDRATEAFMVNFYTDWIGRGSASVAQSIAAAQERIRATDPHPYYWAAFAVIGRWD